MVFFTHVRHAGSELLHNRTPLPILLIAHLLF
jgi:hypothetical protein